MTQRKVYFGAAFVALLAALGVGPALLERQAIAQGDMVQAPRFEVDPLWPKPMPNTTETYEGKRLQRFVYKGLGPVRRGS